MMLSSIFIFIFIYYQLASIDPAFSIQSISMDNLIML